MIFAFSVGQFGEGLREDLTKYRKAFAEEWGMKGWRNEQFVKQHIDEAQRPTENQIEDMYKQNEQESVQTERTDFLNDLHNTQKQRSQHKPKPR